MHPPKSTTASDANNFCRAVDPTHLMLALGLLTVLLSHCLRMLVIAILILWSNNLTKLSNLNSVTDVQCMLKAV